MTIEETVAQLIDATLRGRTIVQASGALRTHGLSDYYIRINGEGEERYHTTILKYRTENRYFLVRIINLYEAIDIVKEHWDDRFTDVDWKGSV